MSFDLVGNERGRELIVPVYQIVQFIIDKLIFECAAEKREDSLDICDDVSIGSKVCSLVHYEYDYLGTSTIQ